MTKITEDQIVHLSELANLNISKNEVKKFQKQLSSIIDYVSELSQVDTQDVEPTSQTTNLTNIKREDVIDQRDSLTTEEALSGTENTHNGYFKVPAIFEEK